MKAYWQFPIDTFDYPLMGFKWKNKYYFDTVLPMGLRSAAMACKRITDAVSFIYLDDFQGVELCEKAWSAFHFLHHLIDEVGLVESVSKACVPSIK